MEPKWRFFDRSKQVCFYCYCWGEIVLISFMGGGLLQSGTSHLLLSGLFNSIQFILYSPKSQITYFPPEGFTNYTHKTFQDLRLDH